MARKSVDNRNKKRANLANKYREARAQLRASSINPELSDEQRLEATVKLQKMPRDASKSRVRNRCNVCSRPRGNYRLTGMCRLHERLLVLRGDIPGMRKASW